MLTVTVSQINRYVKAVLEEDRKLQDLYVKGEISNFRDHYGSGHWYFTLKDENAAVRCVVFKGDAEQLLFHPEDSMAVLVRARVGFFERDGSYQLYVSDIQPDGVGAMALAYEQTKTRLEQQGLFDAARKKPIPPMPRRIGIVTSQTGAALQDMLQVLGRRYPLCTAVIAPAPVQGKEAAAAIINKLERLDTQGNCDVIIIGRGGGSAEDLWCFNDEALAKAVFLCKTPVISAVGHETDYTILDFVADLRAPTPSAAAELASPSGEELAEQLKKLKYELFQRVQLCLARHQERLNVVQQSHVLQRLPASISAGKEKLDFFTKALYNRKRIFIQDKRRQLDMQATLLDSLSPLKTMKRGYVIASIADDVVCDVSALQQDQNLQLHFWNGLANVKVQTVSKEESHER